jgi:hypothetical protein
MDFVWLCVDLLWIMRGCVLICMEFVWSCYGFCVDCVWISYGIYVIVMDLLRILCGCVDLLWIMRGCVLICMEVESPAVAASCKQ